MANFSAVVGIATSFRNALDRGYNYPVQIMTDQWARVEEILEGDMVRAAAAVAEIQARGDPIPVWRVTELERIQSLLRQLRIQVDVINARTEGPLLDAIQARQVDGWRNAAETFKAAAREPALSRGTRDRIGVAFDKLGTEAAEIITAISFESSLPLREIMDRAYGQAAVGMINQLIAGVAKGQGPRETARRMRDGAALGLNHLLLVARDQQIRAYREGQRAAYQRTGMVTHYKRLAARNSRTCMACIALDGTIWEVADIMPLHPQDRCTMIPVLDGEDAPTWPGAREWFQRQPEAVQRRMMGRKKWELWKKTGFDLREMNTTHENYTWGPSAQETTLADLRRKFGDGGPGPEPPQPPPPPPPPEPPQPPPPPPEPEPEPAETREETREERRAAIRAEAPPAGRALLDMVDIDAEINERIAQGGQRRVELGNQKKAVADQLIAMRSEIRERDPDIFPGDIPEYAQLLDEYNRLSEEYDQSFQDVAKIRRERSQRLQDVIAIPEADRSTLDVDPIGQYSGEEMGAILEAAQRVRELVPANMIPGRFIDVLRMGGVEAKRRGAGENPPGVAGFAYGGDIYIGGGYLKNVPVIVHEIGHIVESYTPGLLDHAGDFLRSRVTEGEETLSSSDIYPGVALIKDKWKDSYTGRVYGHYYEPFQASGRRPGPGDQINRIQLEATEIISQGLESMARDPLEFAREDYEFYEFIFNLRFWEGDQ